VTNYDAGTRFERETRHHLERNGYWVIKAAGSKGKADLVAIKPGQVLIVQCKRSGICPPAERAEVRRIAALLPHVGVPLVASRPGVTFRELTGNGPKEWRPWVADEIAEGGR
jgi:Holliday junction resolvase